MAKAELESAISELGLSIESVFVPFSHSRNKAEKSPSLNWRVTLKRGASAIMETDYMAGIGHAPSYRQHFGPRNLEQQMRDAMAHWECEHGREATGARRAGRDETATDGFVITGSNAANKRLKPNPIDVIHSLTMDSDAMDYSSFEEWASNYGYETDSRKAESMYRACLETALKLRASIGDDGLAKLREACQDY